MGTDGNIGRKKYCVIFQVLHIRDKPKTVQLKIKWNRIKIQFKNKRKIKVKTNWINSNSHRYWKLVMQNKFVR
jgi:hypothetical protein